MFLSLSGTQRYFFFGNTCSLQLEFWSWGCLSALLMAALPSGAWKQRAQKKWSETEENATSFLYLVQRHHHVCTYFISSKILPCLYKQKRIGSTLCCKKLCLCQCFRGWCSSSWDLPVKAMGTSTKSFTSAWTGYVHTGAQVAKETGCHLLY